MTSVMLIGLLFLNSAPAQAHGQVTATSPKNNAVLATMPAEVWCEFDGDLTVLDGATVNTLIVKDASGRTLQVGNAIVAGARIYATIGVRDAHGRVTASYRVVSEDGHPVEGSISFTVAGVDIAASPEPLESSQSKNTPSRTASAEASTAAVEPTPVPITPTATTLETNVDEHAHHNFFQRHTTHLIQFGFGFAVIGIWFLFDRRRTK